MSEKHSKRPDSEDIHLLQPNKEAANLTMDELLKEMEKEGYKPVSLGDIAKAHGATQEEADKIDKAFQEGKITNLEDLKNQLPKKSEIKKLK